MGLLEQELAERRVEDALPPGSTLRVIRKAARVTQGALAEHCGVERSTVAAWEADRQRPRGKTAVKLMDALRRLAEAADLADLLAQRHLEARGRRRAGANR